MTAIQKYCSVYSVMFRNSLVREMSFKLNFLLWMVVESLWFVGQLVFIEVIFGQVERIGDWTKWQMVLLVGTHQIVSQLFQAFFYTNLVNLPELVRTGKFDFVLLQPVDGQFFTSLRQFGLDSIVNTLVGIAIDFANINAIKALFWSAVVNGLLAPFLLVAILFVATDRKLMRNNPAPLVATILVAITTCAMIGAALGMFLL